MRNRTNPVENEYWREIITQTEHYTAWVDRLSTIAKSAFKWENCPETFNTRYMENVLLYDNGMFGGYNDPDYGLITMPVCEGPHLNIYDEPLSWRINKYPIMRELPADEIVICRNNINATPIKKHVYLYAEKLAALQYTIDCNLKQQQYSHLITCDKKNKLSFANMIDQVYSGAPVVFGDASMGKNVEDIPLHSPLIADKLIDIYHSTYYECLRFFGIKSAGEDKKERVQSAEVDAANGELSINVETQLKCRREFAEKFNKKFGTNITVNFYERTVSDIEQGNQNKNIILD